MNITINVNSGEDELSPFHTVRRVMTVICSPYDHLPSNRPASTHPRGHAQISQNGSIAPAYGLLWTNGSDKINLEY